MKTAFSILAIIVTFTNLAIAGDEMKFNFSINAVTEGSRHVAGGTFNIWKTDEFLKCTGFRTHGIAKEPVSMYMLFSYLCVPTMELFKFPLAEGNTWTQDGAWKVKAETTIENHETINISTSTFQDCLKHKTIITGAQADSEGANAFLNGTRYLWFAKGVGLVKMLYKHSNGVTTEAELTKYEVSGKSEQYLPLKIGNTWTYRWKNKYRNEAVIETYRVGEPGNRDVEVPISRERAVNTRPAIEVRTTGVEKLDLSQDSIVQVSAKPKGGFNFPYYLFVPKQIDPNRGIHILVEINNTGWCSDDLDIHDQRARRLVTSSRTNQIARKLSVPLLVPVFPRPERQRLMYTHALDRDTLLVREGYLKRIDLQLIEIIKDAKRLLRGNDIRIKDKVFMNGFSASGTFANRFAILHPTIVRAVAAGGINCIPTFPTAQWHNVTVRYPVGIADLKEIAGIDFDENAYKKVSQYIYMGYLDRNDTIPQGEAYTGQSYDKEDVELIKTLIGTEMPKRWKVSQSIYNELRIPAQFVTYYSTAHVIKKEMVDDIVKFFAANSGDSIVEIKPHRYPFVEYEEIKEAHINGLYWREDERIPMWARHPKEGKRKISFIISIQDWMKGQDHQQLDIFRKKAGFDFVLKADGYEDISITEKNFWGTKSSNDGSFQGFVVSLSPSQLEKMASAVEYTIVPGNQSEEYTWKVNEGVRLIIKMMKEY